MGANNVENSPPVERESAWFLEEVVTSNASRCICSTDVGQGNKLSHIRRSPEDLPTTLLKQRTGTLNMAVHK